MKSRPTPETLLTAIRAKCMECSGHCRKEVEHCKIRECPLYPYRNVQAAGFGLERRMKIEGQISIFNTENEMKNVI